MLRASCLLLAVVGSWAAPQPPKVTLKVTDQKLSEVLGDVSEATGVTVFATGAALEAPVTVALEDADLDTAVQAIAEAIEGSWLRTYVVEPKGTQPAEETTSVLLERLQVAWRDWMLSRTEEQLDAFRAKALAAVGGTPSLPEMTADGGMAFDIVETLQPPFGSEQVTLQAQGAEIKEALALFTLDCGYMTLLDSAVTGQVTVDATQAELPDVLDDLCEQVGAQWRPVYLIGKARPITPDEMEQRFSEMLERGAAEFWKLPPEQRADIVQQLTSRMQSIPPEVQSMIKSSPWTSRLMGRAMQFVFTLTPDQRREVAPLLQGAVKLFSP